MNKKHFELLNTEAAVIVDRLALGTGYDYGCMVIKDGKLRIAIDEADSSTFVPTPPIFDAHIGTHWNLRVNKIKMTSARYGHAYVLHYLASNGLVPPPHGIEVGDKVCADYGGQKCDGIVGAVDESNLPIYVEFDSGVLDRGHWFTAEKIELIARGKDSPIGEKPANVFRIGDKVRTLVAQTWGAEAPHAGQIGIIDEADHSFEFGYHVSFKHDILSYGYAAHQLELIEAAPVV